ncbi:unnamed protein product [Symbiodinium natans]|uniref:Uncharacterized protein n=1 Tax=Symbiodinium natans TaxID=878477 RepID=A0A812V2P2_9DINO|nr:unnamed protein product [Symbiodinium natans]
MPPNFLTEIEQNTSSSAMAPRTKRRADANGQIAAEQQGPDNHLLQDLLRFTLYRSQDVAMLMRSCGFALLLVSEELKDKVVKAMAAYEDKLTEQHNGDVSAARNKAKAERRPLPPHPWGFRKYYTFIVLMNVLKGALPSTASEALEAVAALIELSEEAIDIQVAACQTKFRSPLQGRVWKFALLPTAAMTQDTKNHISTLLHAKFEGVRFEVARESQTELESKLWQRLQTNK